MIGDIGVPGSIDDNTNACTNINAYAINAAAVCTQLATWQNAQ